MNTPNRCENCGRDNISPGFKLCGRCAQQEAEDERVNDRLLYESTEPNLTNIERNSEES